MLKYPFNGVPILTNSFRAKTDKNPHPGEDYALSNRTAIIAMAAGRVIKVQPAIEKVAGVRQWIANTQNDPYKRQLGKIMVLRSLKTEDYGNYIKIDHGNGVSTLYAHLDETSVHEGNIVKEGELIGYSDSTGNSTGGHIHIEIRKNDIVVDPNKFDFQFTGEGGVVSEITELKDKVTISVSTLYVRSGPAKTHPLAGSKELHRNDIVDVVGFTEGQEIDGNKFWYKSTKGNYFWAGGTNKPVPVVSERIDMTKEEYEARKLDLDNRRDSLEARKVELENATTENNTKIDEFNKDWEQFMADSAGLSFDEPQVEEVPVEVPTEELHVVEETPAEVAEEAQGLSVEEEKKTAEETVSKLESLISDIKGKFGL